jgi:hypothetical protein
MDYLVKYCVERNFKLPLFENPCPICPSSLQQLIIGPHGYPYQRQRWAGSRGTGSKRSSASKNFLCAVPESHQAGQICPFEWYWGASPTVEATPGPLPTSRSCSKTTCPQNGKTCRAPTKSPVWVSIEKDLLIRLAFQPGRHWIHGSRIIGMKGGR